MDAIEILGGILDGGSKDGGGGLGGKILKELLKGTRRGTSQQQSKAPASSPSQRDGGFRGSGNIEQQARELEDLFGVARDRQASPTAETSQLPQSRRRHTCPPDFDDVGTRYRRPRAERQAPPPPQPMESQDEVLVLIRAMINAAKSDGRVTQEEQQAILNRIANPSQQAVQFLQDEFSKPLDLREFAWSVPIGMEEKAYMLSLAAIDLDAQSEASYLRDLAHGLRLSPEECNEIHQQLGAPAIY